LTSGIKDFKGLDGNVSISLNFYSFVIWNKKRIEIHLVISTNLFIPHNRKVVGGWQAVVVMSE